MTLSLLSCTQKAKTEIHFSDGSVSAAIIKSGEATAALNADLFVKNQAQEQKKIDILFLSALDSVHDEYAVDIIANCAVEKIYLPKQANKGERYDALVAAADENSAALIEVDSSVSLPLSDVSIDLYGDDEMTSMTVCTSIGNEKYLIACDNLSSGCFEHLLYNKAKYMVVALEGNNNCIPEICEKLAPKTLYVFTSDKSSVSVPEQKGTNVMYSCESSFSIGK